MVMRSLVLMLTCLDLAASSPLRPAATSRVASEVVLAAEVAVVEGETATIALLLHRVVLTHLPHLLAVGRFHPPRTDKLVKVDQD
jgi:hypothetical protein